MAPTPDHLTQCWRRLARSAIGLLAFLVFAIPAAQARDLVVYGEPTLAPVLETLGALWRASGGNRAHVFVAPTDLSFAQIERDARCDVIFALAGPTTDDAGRRELFDTDSKITVFRNSLVLVGRGATENAPAPAPAQAPAAAVAGKRLAVANPERDAAGRYGVQALRAAGVPLDANDRNLLVAESAAGVLQMLADRKADVGIVYASDAAAHRDVTVLATFAEGSYPAIVYVAAEAANADGESDAEGFLAFLKTPDANAAVTAAGLKPIEEPNRSGPRSRKRSAP